MRRLPDTGLKALWALEGQSATRAELEHALRDKGWAANTYLSRLADKGFASCEKRGGTNWYAPWYPVRTTWPLRAAPSSTRSLAAP